MDAGRFTPDPWRLDRREQAAPDKAAASPVAPGAAAGQWDALLPAGGAATATAVRPPGTAVPDPAAAPAPRGEAAVGGRPAGAAIVTPAGAAAVAPADLPSRSRKRAGAMADGRPARRAPRLAHVPYFLVLALSVASVAWMWHGGTQRARGGTLAMGGALVAAALLRLVLPEGWAGMLASRARIIDVVTLAALAVGLLVAGLMLLTPS